MSIHDGDLGVERHRDYCVPDGGDGQSPSYDTKPKFNWCIPPNEATTMPKESKNGYNIAIAAYQNSKFGQWTFDIYNAEYSLIVAMFFSVFLTFLFCYMLAKYGEKLAQVAIGVF